MTIGLNWTKIGLKLEGTFNVIGSVYCLNWTKIGLKLRVFYSYIFCLTRLNWTKIGLKPRGSVTGSRDKSAFELD